eukprot:117271_1
MDDPGSHQMVAKNFRESEDQFSSIISKDSSEIIRQLLITQSMYQDVLNASNRIVDSPKNGEISEIINLCRCRLVLIEIYIALESSIKPPSYTTLKDKLDKCLLEAANDTQPTDSEFLQTRDTLINHCSILNSIIKCCISLENIQFQETILGLLELRSEIENAQKLSSSEQTITSDGSQFISWSQEVHNILRSKAHVYFHNVFHQYSFTINERSETEIGQSFFARISSFVQSSSAYAVCLIFESEGVRYPIGEGYACPDPEEPFQPLQGLKSWPCIFCYPANVTSSLIDQHWPNLVSILQDKRELLDTFSEVFVHSEHSQDRSGSFCSPRSESSSLHSKSEFSYFCARVSHRVTLVSVFTSDPAEMISAERHERREIVEFISQFAEDIRLIPKLSLAT